MEVLLWRSLCHPFVAGQQRKWDKWSIQDEFDKSKAWVHKKNIIPLVNKAFPVSFGNQGSAIRAISQRGWNPLNFNLLTALTDTKNVVNLTTTLKPSCPLNVSNGLSNNYLDLLS